MPDSEHVTMATLPCRSPEKLAVEESLPGLVCLSFDGTKKLTFGEGRCLIACKGTNYFPYNSLLIEKNSFFMQFF